MLFWRKEASEAYTHIMHSSSWYPERIDQNLPVPVLARELPAVATTPEIVPKMDSKFALMVTVSGFAALEIITLASMATQTAVLISTLGLFVMALTLSYLFQASLAAVRNRSVARAHRAALQDPYARYRVEATTVGHKVCLQLKDYWPQHSAGQTPDYLMRVIQEERFGPEQETEALERLVELQEQAAEYERQAYQYYQRTHQVQEVTGRLQNQLNPG
jgi:hypothetical protein